MISTYLTLLTIALAAIFIYMRTSEDLSSVLAAFTAVVCFVWGFALAPWTVQVLIMGVLFGVERIYFADVRATR